MEIGDVAARLRPSGALTSVEEPRTVVLIAKIWTWGSAFNTFLIAAIFFVNGEMVSGWISVGLAGTFVACWIIFINTGSVRITFSLAVGASMVAVPALQIAMGGYAYSGAQPVWAIGVTTVAALLLGRRATIAVAGYWLALVIGFGFLEQTLKASRPPPEPTLASVFFSYNVAAHLILLVPVVVYLLSRLSAERARSESLLLNVLPAKIADRLKATRAAIVDDFADCSVLFADISGFTSHSRQVPAQQLIKELNTIFTAFDDLTEAHGVQKIKTTGDGYMAVAGVPEPRPDHLSAACDLAMEMQSTMKRLAADLGADLEVRIGVHAGPAVAGIIGTKTFSYDLWGETVNMASRLESYGEPGRIQVSEEVMRRAVSSYEFEPSGTLDMKGFGSVRAFWLTGRRSDPS